MKESEKAKANEISMKITETGIRISKIEMKGGGTDGLEVTYATTEIRNQISSPIEYTKNNSRPVQKELRMLFDDLKVHLLRCLGYYWSNDAVLEMYKANIVASFILTREGDKFMIGGKNKIKEYTTAVNSPLFDADGYDEWEELEQIIEQIKSEAKLFMSGVKGADSRTIIIDYMKANKEVSDAEAAYDDMSDEEKEIIMREAFGDRNLEIIEEDGKMKVSVGEEENGPFIDRPGDNVVAEAPAVELKKKAVKKAEAIKVEEPKKEPVKKAVVKSEPEVTVHEFVDESDDDVPLFLEE